jgi:hypothetical protein
VLLQLQALSLAVKSLFGVSGGAASITSSSNIGEGRLRESPARSVTSPVRGPIKEREYQWFSSWTERNVR